MPDMVEMMRRFDVLLQKQKDYLTYKLVNEWQPISQTNLKTVIYDGDDLKSEDEVNKILKKHLGFSFQNLFPIFVYATRKAIKVDDKLQVNYSLTDEEIEKMVQIIYRSMARGRLRRPLGSTTELFRDPEIYRQADEFFCTAFGDRYPYNYCQQYRVVL